MYASQPAIPAYVLAISSKFVNVRRCSPTCVKVRQSSSNFVKVRQSSSKFVKVRQRSSTFGKRRQDVATICSCKPPYAYAHFGDVCTRANPNYLHLSWRFRQSSSKFVKVCQSVSKFVKLRQSSSTLVKDRHNSSTFDRNRQGSATFCKPPRTSVYFGVVCTQTNPHDLASPNHSHCRGGPAWAYLVHVCVHPRVVHTPCSS